MCPEFFHVVPPYFSDWTCTGIPWLGIWYTSIVMGFDVPMLCRVARYMCCKSLGLKRSRWIGHVRTGPALAHPPPFYTLARWTLLADMSWEMFLVCWLLLRVRFKCSSGHFQVRDCWGMLAQLREGLSSSSDSLHSLLDIFDRICKFAYLATKFFVTLIPASLLTKHSETEIDLRNIILINIVRIANAGPCHS